MRKWGKAGSAERTRTTRTCSEMYYALMRMTRGLMLCRALRFYVFQFDMEAYHDSGRMKEKTFKVIWVTRGLRVPPYLRRKMLSCRYPTYKPRPHAD